MKLRDYDDDEDDNNYNNISEITFAPLEEKTSYYKSSSLTAVSRDFVF